MTDPVARVAALEARVGELETVILNMGTAVANVRTDADGRGRPSWRMLVEMAVRPLVERRTGATRAARLDALRNAINAPPA